MWLRFSEYKLHCHCCQSWIVWDELSMFIQWHVVLHWSQKFEPSKWACPLSLMLASWHWCCSPNKPQHSRLSVRSTDWSKVSSASVHKHKPPQEVESAVVIFLRHITTHLSQSIIKQKPDLFIYLFLTKTLN